jgi:prevent-host-death family protein
VVVEDVERGWEKLPKGLLWPWPFFLAIIKPVVDVSVAEAKNRFSELLRSVEAGEEVLITRNGKPVAQLVPLPRARRTVRFGTMRGQIHLKPGWDAPIDINKFLPGEF